MVRNSFTENYANGVETSYTNKEYLFEGPEGVKWELGFAYFCTGKMRFGSLGLGSLGLGITNTKLGMGNVSRNYTAYEVNAQ